MSGYVYLLHFDAAYHHARHYLGFSRQLKERIDAHRAGKGARLTQVIKEAGIGFKCVRVWFGDRRTERGLKKQKNGPRLCPVCVRIRERSRTTSTHEGS